MPYRHLFFTHAPLQSGLTEAILRDREIDPAEALVVRVRGSYTGEGAAPYRVLDGAEFGQRRGWNWPAHRRYNRGAVARFRERVLDRMAPGYAVYAPMYTYWFIRAAAAGAGSVNLLEDGLLSYGSDEELAAWEARGRRAGWRGAVRGLRDGLAAAPEQRSGRSSAREILAGVDRCYVTSPHCFPQVGSARKTVCANVFPPRYPGRYDGTIILALSCLVEADYLVLSDYLELIDGVLGRVRGRWPAPLYAKLHPQQAGSGHAGAYRSLLHGHGARELGQGTELEGLAAGNRIHFVTGMSTLGLHVAATGNPVYTYLEAIGRYAPRAVAALPVAALGAYREQTSPL